MPRVTIATSLWDPLIIELGEKVYTSVPRSARLIQDLNDLRKKYKEKQIEDLDYLSQSLGLTFGVNPEEFRTLDEAYLLAIVEEATEYIGKGKPAKSKDDAEGRESPIPEPVAPETPGEQKNA